MVPGNEIPAVQPSTLHRLMGNVRLRFFHKLVGIMIIVSVIPLLISLLVTNFVVRAGEVNDAKERLAAVSNGIGGEVARNAATVENGITALSNLPLVNTRGEYPNINQTQVEELRRNFQQIEEITLLDLEGRTLVASDNLGQGDWISREVFQAAAAGNAALSQAHRLPGRPGLFYTQAVPVADALGQWGVLTVEVPASGLTEIATQTKLGGTGFAFLVDGEGRFTSHSDPAILLTKWEEGVTLISQGEVGVGWVNQLGGEWLCASSQVVIPSSLAGPWQAVSCQPKAEILGAIPSAQRVMQWSILAAFGLAVAAGLAMSRALVKPIRLLADGAARVENGELEHRVRETTSDEISDLARSFNSMAEALAQKIGELRRADVLLRNANDELEEKVAERTRDLAQVNAMLTTQITEGQRVEEQRKALELIALARSKLATIGEMAAGVAHEINQPLTYLNIMIESTREDLESDSLDDTRMLQRLDQSHRQIERISRILDHIRVFGRDDDEEMTGVDIELILDDTMVLLGEKLRLRNIQLDRVFDPALPEVFGNANQLEQVFINLIQNSIDALSDDRQGGNITVSVASLPGRSMVRISVTDTGMGIHPAQLDQIFDPFFTTKEPGQGTGLGLSIVSGIIQAHGGTISCESRVREGTTVSFTLPTTGGWSAGSQGAGD